MKPILVVLDTNIWLSGLFWEGEASKIIKLTEKKIITPVVTEKTLEEITEVIKRESKFQEFLEEREKNIESLIRKIISLSEIKETKEKIVEIKQNPSDNIFLEAALEGNVRYIISYDVKVLDKPCTLVREHFEHPKVPNKPRNSVRGETQGLFDNHLLELKKFREIKIIKPSEFLVIIRI